MPSLSALSSVESQMPLLLSRAAFYETARLCFLFLPLFLCHSPANSHCTIKGIDLFMSLPTVMIVIY